MASANRFFGRLELYEDVDFAASFGTPVEFEQEFGSEVFVVHGHDGAAKSAVAHFVERLGLVPIILHEQPDGGDTVIEKFERHSGKVGFAIGLLTPDDVCRPVDAGEVKTQRRARQNVVFETGYFMGKLDQGCVRMLYKNGVELPADVDEFYTSH